MGMRTKGVSFNEENPTDKELLEFAATYQNFSGKVKAWIKADLENARRRQRTSTESGGIRIRVGN